jgi:hypothetical protein
VHSSASGPLPQESLRVQYTSNLLSLYYPSFLQSCSDDIMSDNLLSLAGWYILPNVSPFLCFHLFLCLAIHQTTICYVYSTNHPLLDAGDSIISSTIFLILLKTRFSISLHNIRLFVLDQVKIRIPMADCQSTLQLVTGWAQTAFYAIWIRAGDPKPQPGTKTFVQHRKRINILVIVAYLLYTIYEADFQLRTAGNLYQDLGVGLDVNDRGINSRFRRL